MYACFKLEFTQCLYLGLSGKLSELHKQNNDKKIINK